MANIYCILNYKGHCVYSPNTANKVKLKFSTLTSKLYLKKTCKMTPKVPNVCCFLRLSVCLGTLGQNPYVRLQLYTA
jgi:hypothetical protein